MILVDTPIWIDHLRKYYTPFAQLLELGKVAIHPFVIGELACGQLKKRKDILTLLKALPSATQVENDEVLYFIEKHKLSGKGLGFVDMHLLTSSLVDSHFLWTRDKRLQASAEELAISYQY